MMLVPTYLKQSPIHGLGLFAAEPIPKGTAMWRYQEGVDIMIPLPLVATLPDLAQAYLRRYAYETPQFPGGLILNFDNSRFINHSTDPNTDNTGEVTVARRDIAKDEEITCDYGEFCKEFDLRD
ncbi:MAG TPA: SET domain-containing protein-lysine N-methyltransferase [Azospirillaceae bacterium]|nr:SET domain-containing protein-lysine N-methyltransferase [Azospirillaceae bacterium]